MRSFYSVFVLWKISRRLESSLCCPIYKSGARDDCSKYRPISVLPVLSCAFEKVVHSQLYDYLDRNRLIYKHQSRFALYVQLLPALRPAQMTGTENIDTGKYTSLIFIDLKKAFDIVKSWYFIEKARKIRNKGLKLIWFTSFLQGRKQLCSVNSTSSNINDIRCGVPQGSSLGALLFLISINDLLLCLSQGTFAMYADDTAIPQSFKCLSALQGDLNSDLANLQN